MNNFILIETNDEGEEMTRRILSPLWAAVVKRIVKRERVYQAIDGERAYQDKYNTAESKGEHEISAFILYMETYLGHARELASTYAEEKVREQILSKIRCVAALGVACMEQHGAPLRD